MKSIPVPRFVFPTGTIPSTAVKCCCSRVRGAGVDGTCVMGGEERLVVMLGATVTGAGAVEGKL
jgi:hypothetical protein